MTHLPFILASYGLALAVLGALGALALRRHRAARRLLAVLER